MSRRWRFLFLVPLALMLVIGVERLASHSREPADQAEASSIQSQATQRPSPTKPSLVRRIARLVPLYSAGSLYVKKPRPQKPTKRAHQKKRSRPPAKQPKLTKAAPRPSPPLEGEHPVLEVGYEEIGFERYLNIIERVGQFFVMTQTKLGSMLSI